MRVSLHGYRTRKILKKDLGKNKTDSTNKRDNQGLNLEHKIGHETAP